MKILSFDVSTTATGAVLYNQESRTHIHKLFKADGSDINVRIVDIYKAVKVWIVDKKFDMLLITKASAGSMNPSILQLEGLLLSLAIDRGIPIDYSPDISWYSLFGDAGDQRSKKKKKSIERYINENKLIPEYNAVSYSGKTISKITIGVMKVVEKGDTCITNHFEITDDIADAWNCADLYADRIKRQELHFQKSEIQVSINKERAKSKSIRSKLKVVHQKARANAIEQQVYSKGVERGDKSRTTAFSLKVRVKRATELQRQYDKLESDLQQSEGMIEYLMKKKNTL